MRACSTSAPTRRSRAFDGEPFELLASRRRDVISQAERPPPRAPRRRGAGGHVRRPDRCSRRSPAATRLASGASSRHCARRGGRREDARRDQRPRRDPARGRRRRAGRPRALHPVAAARPARAIASRRRRARSRTASATCGSRPSCPRCPRRSCTARRCSDRCARGATSCASTTRPRCATRSGTAAPTPRTSGACSRSSRAARGSSSPCPSSRARRWSRCSARIPDRVEVVRSGVSEAFHPGADAAAARAAFGLERPYVLTVGSLIARKNLEALTQAADALRREGIDLVAAGSGRGYMRAGASSVRELGLRGRGAPARALRRSRRVHAPLALRGLRPARAGGDGLRRPGGGVRPGSAAGGVRRTPRCSSTRPTRAP